VQPGQWVAHRLIAQFGLEQCHLMQLGVAFSQRAGDTQLRVVPLRHVVQQEQAADAPAAFAELADAQLQHQCRLSQNQRCGPRVTAAEKICQLLAEHRPFREWLASRHVTPGQPAPGIVAIHHAAQRVEHQHRVGQGAERSRCDSCTTLNRPLLRIGQPNPTAAMAELSGVGAAPNSRTPSTM